MSGTNGKEYTLFRPYYFFFVASWSGQAQTPDCQWNCSAIIQVHRHSKAFSQKDCFSPLETGAPLVDPRSVLVRKCMSSYYKLAQVRIPDWPANISLFCPMTNNWFAGVSIAWPSASLENNIITTFPFFICPAHPNLRTWNSNLKLLSFVYFILLVCFGCCILNLLLFYFPHHAKSRHKVPWGHVPIELKKRVLKMCR
jgi:hypothetical protein